MKIFLMFLVFPAFLMAQTNGIMQKMSAQGDLSFKSDVGMSLNGLTTNSGFTQSGGMKPVLANYAPFRRSTVELNLMFQDEQNATEVFTKESLGSFEKAGNSLNTSFWLKYGSNFMGLIETFAGFTVVESDDTNDNNKAIVDLSERSTFTNMLGFGTYALDLHSLYQLGRTGDHLISLSSNFSRNNSILLKDASRNLKKARTLGMIGTSLAVIGGTTFLYGLSQNNDDDVQRGLIIGGSFSLAALIMKILSVNAVDDAGIAAGEFSNSLQTDWQKRYFARFGTGLRDYNKHWKTGLTLHFTGWGLLVASSFFPSDEVKRIGVYGGLIAIAVGYVYREWVAPYQLGSAADDLYNLGDGLVENKK